MASSKKGIPSIAGFSFRRTDDQRFNELIDRVANWPIQEWSSGLCNRLGMKELCISFQNSIGCQWAGRNGQTWGVGYLLCYRTQIIIIINMQRGWLLWLVRDGRERKESHSHSHHNSWLFGQDKNRPIDGKGCHESAFSFSLCLLNRAQIIETFVALGVAHIHFDGSCLVGHLHWKFMPVMFARS